MKNVKRLIDLDRGILVGLLIGEASFGGDGRKPAVVVRMHTRHRPVLEWLAERVEGSRLYGPYTHGGRDYMQWLCRGRALPALLAEVEGEIAALDPHVASRIARMRADYASALAA